MRVRLVVDRWDQPVDGDYVTHVRGAEVDVPDDVGAWLTGAGSAVEVAGEASGGDKPARRGRRKAADN